MENLKERRLGLGLTQRQVARRCGCCPEYISLIERGKMKGSAELLEKIRVVFGGKRVVKERTDEEKVWHELWCDRYGS